MVLAGISLGCSDGAGPRGEHPEVKSYQVRGMIRQLKDSDRPGTQVWIHHEAIPEFIGIDGRVQGMEAMTMPFEVADTVDLTGIEVGTRIRFELTVDWNAAEPAVITALEPLPPDTRLSFEASD